MKRISGEVLLELLLQMKTSAEKNLVVNVFLTKGCLGVWGKSHTFIFNFCITSHHTLSRLKKTCIYYFGFCRSRVQVV